MTDNLKSTPRGHSHRQKKRHAPHNKDADQWPLKA